MAALLLQLQVFNVDPDVPFIIQVGDVLLSAPFFRWDGTHWVDATGDFDLCLSADQTYLEFHNRTGAPNQFAYRYVSLSWLSARVGVK